MNKTFLFLIRLSLLGAIPTAKGSYTLKGMTELKGNAEGDCFFLTAPSIEGVFNLFVLNPFKLCVCVCWCLREGGFGNKAVRRKKINLVITIRRQHILLV